MSKVLDEEEVMDWPAWSATAATISVLAVGLSAIVSYRTRRAEAAQAALRPTEQRAISQQREENRKEEDRRKEEEDQKKTIATTEEDADSLPVLEELPELEEEDEDGRTEVTEAQKEKEEEEEETTKDLIRDHGAIPEMNEAGLVRGKKTTSIRDGRRQRQIYQMEDVCLVEAPLNGDVNRALFAVFDGHAGRFAAEAAKEIFSKHVQKNIDRTTGAVDFAEVFSGVETELAAEDGGGGTKKYDCEGCTATAAYIYKYEGKRYLQVANVGDSSAFLVTNGKAKMVSVDHKVSNPAEKERIRGMGVAIEDRHTRLPTIGLAVSRALGDFFAKEVKSGLSGEPYVHPTIQLTSKDSHLIIASDGLWDIVTGEQAAKIAGNKTSAVEISQALIDVAVAAPDCHDNVTVITILL